MTFYGNHSDFGSTTPKINNFICLVVYSVSLWILDDSVSQSNIILVEPNCSHRIYNHVLDPPLFESIKSSCYL